MFRLYFVILLLLVSLSNAHFPPQCRCVCHVGRLAITESRRDCFLPGAGDCVVRLCRRYNRAGFACCMPDYSPIPLLEITSRTPLPSPVPNKPKPGPTQAHHHHPQPSMNVDMEMYPSMEPMMPTMEPMMPSMAPMMSSMAPMMPSMEPTMPSMEAAMVPSSPSMTLAPSMSSSLTPSPSASPNVATIHFAADNEATLYINGNVVSSVNDWSIFATVTVQLQEGDVVSILATDYGWSYGAIVAIEMSDSLYVTGGPGWKAMKVYEMGDMSVDPNVWTQQTFSSCSWPMARILPDNGSWAPGKSLNFPYDLGARYVWADGAGVNDAIYLRFVVGMEDC